VITKSLKEHLRKSFKRGSVACLTGAGISAESGIPTFRGEGGLWEKYNPEEYARAEGLVALLRAHPERLAGFIIDVYGVLLKAKPNPGHAALAVLEKTGCVRGVITQNIDNLHSEAGNRNVIELHGNAFRIRCDSCSGQLTVEKGRMKEMTQLLTRAGHSRTQILKILCRYFPRCECGGRFRTDIVLFGEALPPDAITDARRYLDASDTLMVIGTSLAVYPAADLPVYAKQRGATLIEINHEPGFLLGFCDYTVYGEASRILPEMVKLAGNG
jgi:NAD-dependent deacetylase